MVARSNSAPLNAVDNGCQRAALDSPLDDLMQKLADDLRTTLLLPLLHTHLNPLRHIQRHIIRVRLLPHPHLLILPFRDDAEHLLDRLTVLSEQLARFVRGQPVVKERELFVGLLGGGERDLMRVEGSFDVLTVEGFWCAPALLRNGVTELSQIYESGCTSFLP